MHPADAPAVAVDDPADERLAEYRDLTDAELRRASDADAGRFIAEGELVVRRLLDAPLRIRSVVVTPTRLRSLAPALEGVSAPVYVVSQEVLNAVGGFTIHRGVLAAADRPPARPWREVVAGATRLALVEDVNDQENLGSLFRNAAGLGIDALLLSPRSADPYYRRTVRVSMGHVLHLPFARIEPWPAALDELAATTSIVALTPAGDVELRDIPVDPDARVAIALGAEGPGLSDDVVGRAQIRARIAMAPGVDSLNVAAASAVAFHHFGRPVPR